MPIQGLPTKTHVCDLCVVGGGLAGTIAAVSAARRGLRVVLMQDRPVLGGNSSSEIRMWVRGAKGTYDRETGLLEEMEEENVYRNPTLSASGWDLTLYSTVRAEKNITLLLNCSCLRAEREGREIRRITGWQLNTYTFHTVEARLFADCSGDSILAHLTGAPYRHGREANAEYGETIGPAEADGKTMGSSCLLQARETDHPVPFIPPEWAYRYDTDEDMAAVPVNGVEYAVPRLHRVGTDGGNLWWIEIGGEGDTLRDADENRDELLRIALGVWDHIKNQGDHDRDNWELEWIGFLPGKRESGRYIGAHVLTQQEISAGGLFPDVVAYGGWPMDDHDPRGFYAKGERDPASRMFPAPSPYGIPYRCLYSEAIPNLFFAGRNISATHAAISSTRVMGTCSLLGQAVGTAAALCGKYGVLPAGLFPHRVDELQQALLEDGVFLPGVPRRVPDLTREARLSLAPEETAVLQNGTERPRTEPGENAVTLPLGSSVTFAFDAPRQVEALRFYADPDYTRETVSVNKKMRVFPMRLHTGRDFVPVRVAATIVKAFTVTADGEEIFSAENNYHALVTVPVRQEVRSLTVTFRETHGAPAVRLFACDIR